MSRFARNLSVALRCERLIARHRIAAARRQTGYMVLAAVAAGTGLVMLNLAAFLALGTAFGEPLAALLVGLVNVALAGGLGWLASRSAGEADLAPAIELRDAAVADLEAEFETTAQDVQALLLGLRQKARDPLGTAAQELLVPLFAGLVKSLRK